MPVGADIRPRLRLLGKFRLEGADGTEFTLRGRRARAALAVVALTPDFAIGRERLATLLWSDRSEDQARASLRQTLRELRQAFDQADPAALRIDRTTVFLSAERLWIDVIEAFELLRMDSLTAREGAALCRRGLLIDLDLHASEFEAWLRMERNSWMQRTIDELGRALERAEIAGDLSQAMPFATTLLSLEPTHEPTHRALMRLYATQGDRAAALRQYSMLRELLERDLGATPSKSTEKLLTEINNNQIDGKLFANQINKIVDLDYTEIRSRPSIIVLPFLNIDYKMTQDYLVDGLTDDIITSLARFKELHVISRNTSFDLKKREIPFHQIRHLIKVHYILQGSLRQLVGHLRLNLQLSEALTGYQVWTDRYEVPTARVVELMDDVVARIMSAVLPAVELHETRATRQKSEAELAAYDCYLRGKHLLYNAPSRETAEQAQRLLERAIELDPDLFLAYGHLTRLYNTDMIGTVAGGSLDQNRARAFTLAGRALAFDPGSALAHFSMGWCCLWRKEWARAQQHFERIQTLNPFDPHRLSDIATGFMYLGEHGRALAQIERAMQLDPGYPEDYLADLAEIRFAMQEYNEALSLLARVTHQTPYRRIWRTAANAHLGRLTEARREAQSFLDHIRSIWIGPQNAGPVEFTAWMFRHLPFALAEDEARLRDGLRRAGLPA